MDADMTIDERSGMELRADAENGKQQTADRIAALEAEVERLKASPRQPVDNYRTALWETREALRLLAGAICGDAGGTCPCPLCRCGPGHSADCPTSIILARHAHLVEREKGEGDGE